jgi:hypothetical protein
VASNFSDDARRAEILQRARTGLEEDLDDLRAELMDVLPEFEQRLRQRSDALPSWLKIPPSQVRALFHLKAISPRTEASETDSAAPPADANAPAAHGILGPRAVALAAGRIEAFIERWFTDGPASAALELEDEAEDEAQNEAIEIEELSNDYDDLTHYLGELAGEARRVAREAGATMDAWLDGVLTQLDAQREADALALEELVRQGDVRRGNRARQEIADLWEDQRRQAADLQARWNPVAELIDEGLDMTESGLEELAALLARARDGLREGLLSANAALAERLPKFEIPPPAPHVPAPAPEPAATPPTVPTQPYLDLKSTPTAGPAANPDSSGDLSEAEAREEVEIEGEKQDSKEQKAEPETPQEADRAIDRDAEPNGEQAAEQDDESEIDDFNTIPDMTYVPGIIPLDEPTSEPEMAGLESRSVSDYSEPSLDAFDKLDKPEYPDAAPETPTQRMYTRGDTPSAGHPAAPDRTLTAIAGEDSSSEVRREETLPEVRSAQDAPAEREPKELEPKERKPEELGPKLRDPAEEIETLAPAEGSSADEATYTSCFRVRLGYKPVRMAEIVAVLLPPALVLGAMAALSLLHLSGAEAAFNPFERWSWAVSAIAVACAWLLLVPTGLHWRSKWRGKKLIILRHTDVREEAELIFDARELRLDRSAWRWDGLERAELRRWDSPLDDVRGWTLSLAAPDAPLLRLAAPESNRKKWQNAPYQLDEIPYDAWQVDTYDFDVICRRAL